MLRLMLRNLFINLSFKISSSSISLSTLIFLYIFREAAGNNIEVTLTVQSLLYTEISTADASTISSQAREGLFGTAGKRRKRQTNSTPTSGIVVNNEADSSGTCKGIIYSFYSLFLFIHFVILIFIVYSCNHLLIVHILMCLFHSSLIGNFSFFN